MKMVGGARKGSRTGGWINSVAGLPGHPNSATPLRRHNRGLNRFFVFFLLSKRTALQSLQGARGVGIKAA